jgi:anti-repressor protein
MNELIKVDYSNDRPAVSARELHEFLEVGARYNDWFPRMCEYGFTQGVDFNLLKNEQVRIEGTRTVIRTVDDAAITIDMAKEICMLQRNEKGKIARQYFLQLEKEWNSPERVMARALQLAQQTINSMGCEIKELQVTNSRLTVDNQIMQPKAEYFDELVERNTLTNFRETAKQLGVPPKSLVSFLLERKYLYRDKKGHLLPYEDKNNGLFEVKESFNEKTKWSGVQTLVTPKGRETFRLLYPTK